MLLLLALGAAQPTTTATAAGAPTQQQTMTVSFGNSTQRHQLNEPGAMSVTLDSYPVVDSSLPDIGVQMWNGSACTRFPSYEYSRLHHSTAWDEATLTNSLQYGWGGFTVTHTRAGPLSINLEITISNDPKNRSDTSLLVPICGISLLPSAQPINTSNHRVAGGVGPCPGTWNEGCYGPRCPVDYPQAICMDWGNASAAWTQDSDANATGFELSADSCPTPGQAFYRPEFIQQTGRRIEVDESVTLKFTLRFGEGWNSAPKGTSGAMELIRPDLEQFGKTHPYRNVDVGGGTMAALMPSDTVAGASEICKSSSPAECPNPRGWNMLGCRGKKGPDPQAMCNVTTPAGIASFEAKMRTYFSSAVARCQKPELKCRAIMVWSIEGSEYADTTYCGSPDLLPTLAPEMDKIADELFGMITSAGIRAGLTLRPQIITPTPGWNASVPPNRPPWPYYQKKLLLANGEPDEDAITANLLRKANYAIKRWNASVFYVDSTGFPLVSTWDRLRTALPDIVFIPEQSGPMDYATVTPLQNDWKGVPIAANPYTKIIWPQAYNYQLMQVNVNETEHPVSEWAVLAKAGDVFRVDGWYDSAHNKFIEQVLAAVGSIS
jgi:hypothetical protein